MDSLPDDPIRSALQCIQEIGFSMVPETNSSLEYVYETWSTDDIGDRDSGRTTDRQRVADRIRSTGRGRVEFWLTPEFRFLIYFRFDTLDSIVSSPVWVSGAHASAFGTEDYTRETAENRTELLVTLFVELSELFDPWYAFTHVYDDRPEGIFPEDTPPESGLERLPWLSVFGPEWSDSVGGTDRLLQAPSWNVQLLDTGSVFVREHDFPSPVYGACEYGSSLSTYEYLFDRRSLAEMRTERRRKQNTIVDPFLDFDPGERGSDVVMCKGHAPLETSVIDYTVTTDALGMSDNCYVLHVSRDERDRLWEVDSGLFVRRLVDENGQPIGTLPDGVSRERELISLSVSTALEPFPPELYKMDTRENVSAIAKLFGLWGLPPDGTIWHNNATCTAHDEADSPTS